jgi:23S rRNA pseudouridine1911/1915/1917 synthase
MSKELIVIPENLPEPARNLLAIIRNRLKISKDEGLQLIQSGAAKINGRYCTKSHHRLEPGDRLELDWVRQPAKPAAGKKDRDLSTFKIEHEDTDLMVVYKPANLLTVPTPHRESKTLLTMLTQHLRKQDREQQAYCVHRLDRGVSGVLVFAKSLEIAEALRDQFAARKPDRQYIAICAGPMKRRQGTIRSHLATDENLNRYSTGDAETGELAITHFEVMEQWEDASLLQIHLETGRRNQIRVHMAESNHPILGDPRYRAHQAEHWAWPFRRLALHAESLGFEHPSTGQAMQFRSSWPEEFRTFRRRVGKSDA